MAEITCPMCGKPNPDDRDVCQYCEARLKPLTDELSRSQPPILPGDEPQDVDTGQLESVLPQWLRDIRQQAQESDDNESGQPQGMEEPDQQNEEADLLAGLRSQAEGNEEVPDWLSSLRSEGEQVNFEETSGEDDDLTALQNMLGKSTPTSQESEDSGLPTWIADLDAEETDQAEQEGLSTFFGEEGIQGSGQTESETPASEPGFAWGADFEPDSALSGEADQEEDSFDIGLPAWLQGAVPSPDVESASNQPAWTQPEEPQSPATEDTKTTPIDENDLPAWLASLGEETSETVASQKTTEPASEGELPAWLSSLGEEDPADISPQEPEEPTAAEELPSWLATLGEETNDAVPSREQSESTDTGETLDWLASFGEESATEEEPSTEFEPMEPLQAEPEGELPDWLTSTSSENVYAEQPAEEIETPAFSDRLETEEAGITPTFIDDEGKPISTEDVDAIFSMDMPEWLSDAEGTLETGATQVDTESQGDELRPAELPSWVQAMRPVESVISETEEVPLEEQPLEERGPLAGLRGVLPAVPGIGPSSKPQAYSIKLQASEDQLSNAAMLEKMLAEELTPKLAVTQRVVLSQRLLRWVITVLLILIVTATVYYNPQITPIPASVPPETSDALNYIKELLPANAPVLLVFDYEAARAGEMEATAAPVIDQMLTLKAPRLSLVASTPTGSGLAERFMQILQADREYTRNQNFVNLGYIPGGAAGVQAFSNDPVTTKPFTTTGESAWATPVLQDVSQLSEFAAIIFLTDNVETAQIWIEQTENYRGDAQMLVVSSAQSGPMLKPYARSGQVTGMITGLEGSAPVEQSNNGRPGMARRYWDAYSFGLLAAALIITLGSLWGLVSNLRALRKEQGQG